MDFALGYLRLGKQSGFLKLFLMLLSHKPLINVDS